MWPSGSCQNVAVGLAVGNLRGVCLIPDGVHQQGRRPTVSRLFPYGLDRFVLRFQFGSPQQRIIERTRVDRVGVCPPVSSP